MERPAHPLPSSVRHLLDDAIAACLQNRWLIGEWDPIAPDDLKVLARHLLSAILAYHEVVPEDSAARE
jgi:hypothetical protein